MICEFDRAELVNLDLSVMDRRNIAQDHLQAYHGKDKLIKTLLAWKVERLDALHTKLSTLIEQAESVTRKE